MSFFEKSRTLGSPTTGCQKVRTTAVDASDRVHRIGQTQTSRRALWPASRIERSRDEDLMSPAWGGGDFHSSNASGRAKRSVKTSSKKRLAASPLFCQEARQTDGERCLADGRDARKVGLRDCRELGAGGDVARRRTPIYQAGAMSFWIQVLRQGT